MVDNDFGFTQYPLVPGHEAVGVVAAVGAQVDRLRVGLTGEMEPMCGSCMSCEWCEAGLQHLCQTVEMTIVGDHRGGFRDPRSGQQLAIRLSAAGRDRIGAAPAR